MSECTVCGAEIGPDDARCPKCEAPVGQNTASFKPAGAERAEEIEPGLIGEGPMLVVRKGPQSGNRFYLDVPRITVGRDPHSGIFLNDLTVSRLHATIEVGEEGVSVQDSGSLNGTYVNGELAERAVLSDGDIVQIGMFEMVFHAGGEQS